MSERSAVVGSRWSRALAWMLLALLAVVLLAHLVTLCDRGVMSFDSYRYVGMAESAQAGSGFRFEGEPTRWPPGYPAILATLMGLGAGTQFAFQMINFSAIVAALAILLSRLAARGLSRTGQLVVALLILLSLPVLYTMNFLLSDAVFLLGAVATIDLLERAQDATGRRSVSFLLLALLALVAACLVRIAGLALVPAFLISALKRRGSASLMSRRPLALGAVVLIGFVIAAGLEFRVFRSGYVAESIGTIKRATAQFGVVDMTVEQAVARASILGQYALNLELRGRWSLRPLFSVVGTAGAALLVSALVAGRNLFRPLETFLIFYLGILCLYPAFTHRLWLPFVPLALGVVAVWASQRPKRVMFPLAAVFVVAYCLLGARVLSWHVASALESPEPLDVRLLIPAPTHR